MSNNNSIIAIVLARGGSKGLPGKNTRSIAGKPCVQWTLEHAHNSDEIASVVLSTDDEHAKDIARSLGVAVHDRPTDLATDTARVDDALRDAAISIEERMGNTPLGYAMLYGNVPVRPADLTDRAVRMLRDTGCDAVQSYLPVGKHHPWWTARLDDDAGRVLPWQGDVLNHGVYRRQDLPPAYVPDGGVCVVSRRALFAACDGPHDFLGADRRGIVSGDDARAVIDIDDAVDLAVAEAVLSTQAETRRALRSAS
ncbi:MAG: acylneuraminate cytidylyltransferase family protein [Planctomycetota bacterium]